MGIIIMHNKRAEKISDLAGNSRKHIKCVNNLNQTSLIGEPSLQNGLEMASSSLKLLPSHASREILVIMGSLTTCDPSDINVTIEVGGSIVFLTLLIKAYQNLSEIFLLLEFKTRRCPVFHNRISS